MRGNFAGLNVKKGCPWLKQRPERKQAANDQHYPLHLIIAHRSDATIFPTALVTVDRLREATCNLTYTDVDPDDQFWIALLSDDAKTAAELFREPMVSWRISRRNLFIGDCSYDTDLAAIHYPITRFGKCGQRSRTTYPTCTCNLRAHQPYQHFFYRRTEATISIC